VRQLQSNVKQTQAKREAIEEQKRKLIEQA
jgi:hypothetical protein